MDALGVLQKLGRGHLVDEVYGALLDVDGEVVATGKAGSVTITLKVNHPTGADPLVVVIDEEVKRSMPKTEPLGAMFYSIDAALHERDPRQAPLPEFRLVDVRLVMPQAERVLEEVYAERVTAAKALLGNDLPILRGA